MSRDQLAHAADFAETRRRVLGVSVFGLLVLVITLGVFKPTGLGHQPVRADDVADGSSRSADRVSAAETGWRHAPLLFLTGLAAGLLAGMIGMGGGVLKISFLLIFLRLDFFFARAIALVTMFFSSATALWGFYRAGSIVWPVALRMLSVALPAAVVGAIIGNSVHPTTLMHAFGIFVIFLGFNTLAFAVGDPDERVMTRSAGARLAGREGRQAGAIGGLHGAACGLFGISGGVIATPLQQLLLRMPMRYAIGNTLFVSAVGTIAAAAIVMSAGIEQGHFALGDVVFVDLCMGTGATLGAPIGNQLGERCSVTALRMLFVALACGAGLFILL